MDNSSEATVIDNSGTFAVSEKFYDNFKKVNTVITLIMCTLGILGNCAGLVIFIRDTSKRKMIIYYYLICLFIFDNIYMLMGVFFLILELIEHLQLVDDNHIAVQCEVYRPYLDMSLNHVSSALLIVMSLERMVALVFPFKLRKFIFTRFPITTILSLIIFSFGYTAPFLISLKVASVYTPLNQTVYYPTVKPEYKEILDTASLIETLILRYVAPIIVFVVNAIIIVSYSRHLRQKDQTLKSGSGNDGQISITAIIVTVSILFILLSLPNMFIQTLMLVDSDYTFYGRYRLTFFFFVEVGDILANINAAADFFIYVLVSSQYRAAFRSWIRRCMTRNDSKAQLDELPKNTHSTLKSGSSNSATGGKRQLEP